jgi:ATP-dependent DNA helicase RecQ
VSQQDLYEFEFKNPTLEPLIKTLMRSYGGLFHDFVPIREQELADRCGLKISKLKEQLKYLNKTGIISYYETSDLPVIYFSAGRQHPDRLPLSKKNYENRKEAAFKRLLTMLHYAENEDKCRSAQLVAYFGEQISNPCGICDVCIANKKNQLVDTDADRIMQKILHIVKIENQHPDKIIHQLAGDPVRIMEVIRIMIDESMISENDQGELTYTE